MDSLYIILGVVAGAVFGVFTYNFFSKPKEDKKDDNSFLLIQNQLNNLAKTLDHRLSESQKSVSDSVKNANESMQFQLSQSFKMVSEASERFARLEETNKQVVSFADQLQSLQDILKNPKQRGILGEYYLETLLKNVLPPGSYEMQYKLGKDDEGKDLIPDAVVFVKDKIIPVDSKFSLENYNRIIEEKDPPLFSSVRFSSKYMLGDRTSSTKDLDNLGLFAISRDPISKKAH